MGLKVNYTTNSRFRPEWVMIPVNPTTTVGLFMNKLQQVNDDNNNDNTQCSVQIIPTEKKIKKKITKKKNTISTFQYFTKKCQHFF